MVEFATIFDELPGMVAEAEAGGNELDALTLFGALLRGKDGI
jgi:hypothetical protein